MNHRRILSIQTIAVVTILLCITTPLHAAIQDKFLFYPSIFPEGNWTPQGIIVQNVFFDAETGYEITPVKTPSGDYTFPFTDPSKRTSTPKGPVLHGWYFPHPQARATVLFCHGNAGNITHRTELARTLHDRLQVSVFMFDYRGYGRSQGSPSERGVLTDGRAARDWLARKEKIAKEDVVLMARSLGGAVAIDLAARDGARGLIIESTFTSVQDMASKMVTPLLAKALVYSPLDSEKKIGNYHGPLLQSHGNADRVIPYKQGTELHQAANQPKRFLTFQGRGHNDRLPAEYYTIELPRFIKNLPEHGKKPSVPEPEKKSTFSPVSSSSPR